MRNRRPVRRQFIRPTWDSTLGSPGKGPHSRNLQATRHSQLHKLRLEKACAGIGRWVWNKYGLDLNAAVKKQSSA
eukprot:6561625-Heterocapsa_arctica.AAC.1